MEDWWVIWDVWIGEVTVSVFSTGKRSNVGGDEDEMIWIWSDDDGASSWHGLGVVDEISRVESEVSWISVWMLTMAVVRKVDAMEPEVLDPSVLMEVVRSREEEVPVVVVVQWARWPVELEVSGWLVVVTVVALESSLGRNAEVLW